MAPKSEAEASWQLAKPIQNGSQLRSVELGRDWWIRIDSAGSYFIPAQMCTRACSATSGAFSAYKGLLIIVKRKRKTLENSRTILKVKLL